VKIVEKINLIFIKCSNASFVIEPKVGLDKKEIINHDGKVIIFWLKK
jgi:hypothetical protein